MAHSEINRRVLLDWIRHCSDGGLPMPTDELIADRFGFVAADAPRTLLADLADRGDITLAGFGASRTIALGRARAALVSSGRPAPSIKAADVVDPEIDTALARIKGIMGREKRAARQAPQPCEALRDEDLEFGDIITADTIHAAGVDVWMAPDPFPASVEAPIALEPMPEEAIIMSEEPSSVPSESASVDAPTPLPSGVVAERAIAHVRQLRDQYGARKRDLADRSYRLGLEAAQLDPFIADLDEVIACIERGEAA